MEANKTAHTATQQQARVWTQYELYCAYCLQGNVRPLTQFEFETFGLPDDHYSLEDIKQEAA